MPQLDRPLALLCPRRRVPASLPLCLTLRTGGEKEKKATSLGNRLCGSASIAQQLTTMSEIHPNVQEQRLVTPPPTLPLVHRKQRFKGKVIVGFDVLGQD